MGPEHWGFKGKISKCQTPQGKGTSPTEGSQGRADFFYIWSTYSFKTWFHTVAQAGPKLLSKHPKSWYYRVCATMPKLPIFLTLMKYVIWNMTLGGCCLWSSFYSPLPTCPFLSKARRLPAQIRPAPVESVAMLLSGGLVAQSTFPHMQSKQSLLWGQGESNICLWECGTTRAGFWYAQLSTKAKIGFPSLA